MGKNRINGRPISNLVARKKTTKKKLHLGQDFGNKKKKNKNI